MFLGSTSNSLSQPLTVASLALRFTQISLLAVSTPRTSLLAGSSPEVSPVLLPIFSSMEALPRTECDDVNFSSPHSSLKNLMVKLKVHS